MPDQKAFEIGYWFGVLVGGFLAGAVCGIAPLVAGEQRKRPTLGTIGLLACILSGFILGIILAAPVALTFTVVILSLAQRSSSSGLQAGTMTQREKIASFLQDMDWRGMSRFVSAPPLFRLLWKLGFQVRPLPFQGFAFYYISGVVGAALMALLWGTSMWFLQWRSWGMPISKALALSALMGLSWSICCTLFWAWYIRRKAKELNLPSWDEYTPPPHQ